MGNSVKPVPPGFHTVNVYLTVPNSAEALAFYEKAFGAKTIMRMAGPGNSTMHAEMTIGDCTVMLSDENPEFGTKSPKTLGGSPTSIHMYLPDVDGALARAMQAGCQALCPIMDMFWGDRFVKVQDPFGHQWSLATHVEDVPPAELERRAAEWVKSMCAQK